MKKNQFKISHLVQLSTIFFMLIVSVACEKVITIDLNSANPSIIIEALLNDTIKGTAVSITKTADYFNGTSLDFVSDAVVQISDKAGNVTNLVETLLPVNGVQTKLYVSQNINPKHLETYTLKVVAEGKTYVSVSTLLEPIAIDSINVKPNLRPRQKDKIIHCYFKDPVNVPNYYRLKIKKISNKSNQNNFFNRIYLRNDQFFDGKINDFQFDGFSFVKGDKIQVELISVDAKVYDYFKTLAAIVQSGGGATSSSPANPNTNIDNFALGYFAAEAISIMHYTIP